MTKNYVAFKEQPIERITSVAMAAPKKIAGALTLTIKAIGLGAVGVDLVQPLDYSFENNSLEIEFSVNGIDQVYKAVYNQATNTILQRIDSVDNSVSAAIYFEVDRNVLFAALENN